MSLELREDAPRFPLQSVRFAHRISATIANSKNTQRMAGSYRMIADKDNKFIADQGYIENMGDARECIEEMYGMILHLSGGDKQKIYEAWLHSGSVHPDNIAECTPEDFWDDREDEE